MRLKVLICIAVFAAVMFGIRIAAHGIVDNFGTLAGFAVIAAMIGAAHLYDRHQRERP